MADIRMKAVIDVNFFCADDARSVYTAAKVVFNQSML